MSKVSIRFFGDRPVRAIWNDESSRWFFSVIDIIGVLNCQDDYEKNRNYWKYLKSKLKRNGSQLGSHTTQLKILAPDGKQRSSDVLDDKDVLELATQFPNQRSSRFIQWFIHGEDTVDGKSKAKAYSLFGSSMIDSIEVGTVKGLQQIHSFIFGGLFDFAGQIRTKNISKGNFMFAPAKYLDNALKTIEKMPEQTFEQIIDKYVEMNVAHPFMEGNGRAARIWLDLILKRNLRFCVDWSLINKADYLDAMKLSPDDSSKIRNLIKNAMTNKIDDRQVYMKGIDYSYYYESDDDSFSSEAPCNPK